MAVKTYSNSSTGSSRARKTQFIRIVRMIVTSNTGRRKTYVNDLIVKR